jgi:subtilisin family serine protease
MRHNRTRIGILALVAGVTASLAATLPTAAAAPAPPPTGSAGAAHKVIVVLRDQLASTPADKKNMTARSGKARSAQNGVLGALAGTAPSHVKHFALGNAFSATVTAAQEQALAKDPRVASVIADRTVALPAPSATPSGPAPAAGVTPQATASGAICPTDPAHPLVEPEALQSINALNSDGTPDAQQLATGAGVKVAFIADGMDPNYADFIRPDGSHVFVDYQDFSGNGFAVVGGNEAFGDASSIAAQGTVVHDLSRFVNQAHPLPPGCNIRVVGVAPGASLVGLVFGSNSSILQAIDWAVTHDHVDVLNESFGLNAYPDYSMRNALTLFNDAAVAAGVTVTVSSGDAGITNTVGSPPDPKVITVAATTDNRLYAQTAYAAFPFSNGRWISDNISALSSSGITQYARTVDLAAPGEGNWADCQPAYSGCRNFQSPPQPTDLQSFGGTSESAPLTAGVAALVIQAYRNSHQGNSPKPALIKSLITGTAHDLGLPADEQGAGLLDARAAVEAALTYPGATTAAPAGVASNLITSQDQFTLTGATGSRQTGSVTVGNAGTHPLTVTAAGRGFAALSSDTQAVSFDSTTQPTFVYYNGATWTYKTVTFTVPAGAERLLARLAFQATGPSDIVRMTLLAPSGTFVANSRPQGGAAPANYANVDVRDPVAGTWTAVLYSAAGAAGYHGAPLILRTDTQKALPVGTITPASFVLAPHSSKTVSASFILPRTSGDTDYSVTFASSDGHKTAVSAVLQTLIDTAHGGAFSGDITGGNARGVSPAQTFSYGFAVPNGRKDLDVSLRLGSDAKDLVDAVLLDPNGELADVGSNVSVDGAGHLQQGLGVQLFDAHPLAGRWHLVVVVQNPVSGREIDELFHGTVTFNGLPTTVTGLPNASNKKLVAGVPVQATVTIKNTGVEPIAVGADPRLNKRQYLLPTPIQGKTSFPLPADPADPPIYVVPPDTSSLTVSSSSSIPAQVEIQSSAAGFDVFGDLRSAQAGSTTSVAQVAEAKGEITKGLWFTGIDEIGPFGPGGEPTGSATMAAAILTDGFDPAVATSTDDPFRISVDPTADGFGTPVVIAPGATGTIQVTIVPQGPKNSVVSGHLNVVTPPLLPAGQTALPFYTTGATVSTVPYSYTIG